MSSIATTYRRHQVVADSRIDLLLRLYRAAINKTESADAVLVEDPDSPQLMLHCLKAVKLVDAIEMGLDLSQGEIPQNVARICQFAKHQLLVPTHESLQSVIRVLRNLMDGYLAIRDAAREVEQQHPFPITQDSLVDSVC